MKSPWFFFALLITQGSDCYATEIAKNPTSPATDNSPAKKNPEFSIFPIGINNDSRNIVPSALVRGAENGKQAVNLEQWLIPFDAVTKALNIKVRTLDAGNMELRSPEIVTTLSEQQLHKDKDLGAALSVADIKRLFNVEVSFDISQYALVLKTTELAVNPNDGAPQATKKVISFEGLETTQPNHFNFSAISQQLRVTGRQKTVNYAGDLLAVGNLERGSWYVDVNQVAIDKPAGWQLREAQYFWKTDEVDYVLGSQPTFWQNRATGDFWGATIVKRNGFKALQQSANGFDPFVRRTTNAIGRTITGQVQPNTLVRLVERFSNRVIAEVFVNSSGIYTFDNVVTNPNMVADYEVLLYPNGILTVEPERINARFVSRASQLEKGASTWIVSGGVNRSLTANNTSSGFNSTANSNTGNLWGVPNGFAGGASYRYGLFESLTVGAGVVYSNGWQALAEFLYSPSWLPLEASVIALNDFNTGKVDYNAQARLQLLNNISVNAISTPFAKSAFLNWNPWPWLVLRGGGAVNTSNTNTVNRNTWFAGTTAYGRFYETFVSVDVNFDSNSVLRSNSVIYRDAWSINYQQDEIRNKLDLAYNFSDSSYAQGDYGHSLHIGGESNKNTNYVNNLSLQSSNVLTNQVNNVAVTPWNYQVSNNNDNKLGVVSWHYRSESILNDGRSLVDMGLGYGVGTSGQGVIASLATVAIPGVELRLNYQDISVISNDRLFFLNVSTNARIEPNLSLSNRSYTLQNLRGEGGLFIQPFLDKNDNGLYDGDDSIYTDNAERLLKLDGYSVPRYNMEVGSQGLYIRQQAGKYRLDLDPSGYPTTGKPSQESYAVEVTAGGYTTISIPFSVTYTIAGRVLDAQGNPVGGAKVEAVPVDKGNKSIAISNGAGVFFVDNLHQGKYQLMLDGQAAHSEIVEIKSDSKTMLEVTIKK